MQGYVGDKHGRKIALTRSLFLMAIPTTLMGCLPTYEMVGILSPILLALCRLIQGVSVGGQLPASLVYTVEKREKSQWGYYGSLPMMASHIGTLLGNLCAALLRQILTDDQLIAWGWRLPFFSGILIAFVAYYLERYAADVHTTRGVYDSETSEQTNPIRAAFRKGNRLAILQTMLTVMLWASGFYVSFIWMAIFMKELLNPPIEQAFWISTLAMLFGMTFLFPIAGHLSDRVGRVKLMLASAIALTAGGPFLFALIGKGNAFVAFVCQLCLGVFLTFFGGPLCAWLVENFSAEVRLTSASLGYDLAHALVGGFSPLFATYLFDEFGKVAPGLIYIVFGTASIIGISITHFCGVDQREEPSAGDLELQEESVSNSAKKDLPEVS